MQQKPGRMVRQSSGKKIIQMIGNGGFLHQGAPSAFPGAVQIPYSGLPLPSQQGTERSLPQVHVHQENLLSGHGKGQGQIHGQIGLSFSGA